MDRLENVLDIGGRQLSPGERQFVTTLLNELEQFQFQAPKDRALMFHPLGGFQRYLIHKVTQVFPRLTSFSIGDERNRRTVVCFKSKKRDQLALQGLAPRNEAPSRNEYVNSPQRSVDHDGSRRSTPASRESSRTRRKPEHADPPPNKSSLRNKPEAGAYLPKPLRSKKAATKRDQMKRSRSLQSSPLRGAERDLSHSVDTDGRRGRSRSQSGKQPRSASLKPTGSNRVRRDRTESPNFSEDDRKLRKPHIPPNVSDVSLKKRGQGLRLEGRVMNGDIEDPDSYSESDAALRVDAEAVRREHERHKKKKKPAERYESSSSSSSTSVEESEASASEEVEVPSHDNYENTGDYDSDADTDERPPSYASLKRSASLKKAQRNLKRVKQAESQHSSRRSSRNEESSGEESSSEVSPEPVSKPTRSSSRAAKTHAKKSSTLPKSTKETPKRSLNESRKAHTLKSAPSSSRKKSHSTPPEKRKSHSTPPEKRKSHNNLAENRKERVEEERPKKSSTSSSKSHSKVKSNPRSNITETDGKKKLKSSKDSLDDYMGHSNPELYHPLPEKQPKDRKAEVNYSSEHYHANPPKSEKVLSNESHNAQCEGTQTEVTGTLSRPKPAEAPQADNQNESAQVKSVGDFLAAMMQSLGIQPQNTQSAYHQPPFHPNMNAFHQHMQNLAPPPPPSSYPPLPPHMIHHIYMSWLGAYYAGVTGTLPPPPPFVMPSSSNPSSGSPMTSLDYLSPNFLSFLKSQEAEAAKLPEGHRNEEPYSSAMYSSAPHYEVPAAGRYPDNRHASSRSFPGADENHISEGEQGRPKPTERPPHEYSSSHSSRGRYGSSLVLTDTDTSSVVSSSRRSEPGVGSSTKPGVMVYVCSQPGSRKSSVSAPLDSVENEVISSTPVRIEPEMKAVLSGSKKTRVKDVKKEKHRQSSKNRASTPHKIEGELTSEARLTNSLVRSTNSPLHAAPSKHTPPTDEAPKAVPTSSNTWLNENLNDSNIIISAVLQDGVPDVPDANNGVPDASQEEIILSLRRAPLATIEDDADELLSTSLASSAASLHNSDRDPGEEPSKTAILQKENPSREEDVSSESERSSSSSLLVEIHTVTPTPDDIVLKSDDFPPPPEEDSPVTPTSSIPAHVQVPAIDDESSSESSEGETPPAALPSHNGVGSSDGSSISEGDHEVHPSNSSYDADQSRVDDVNSGGKLRQNDVSNSMREVADDVVVQDPQFDYYNWKPSDDEWKADKYKKFVEIYNFPPKLSDIEISRYLTKYRGLRLTRVDKTLALCTLTSEDVANELLKEKFPIFSTRPLSEASEKSRKRAKNKLRDAGFEKARAGRPKTDSSAAKRMIAASLGSRNGATSSGKRLNDSGKK